MAANVIGRAITSADYLAYNKAMQDPDTKRQFINLAKVMELAKQTQGNKKRKRTDPLASTLRKRREEIAADSNHGMLHASGRHCDWRCSNCSSNGGKNNEIMSRSGQQT